MNKNKNVTSSEKLKTIILSVIIAIAVWLVAVYVNDPSITVVAKNVPVRLLNEDSLSEKTLIVKNKENLPSVSIKVSGKRSYLMNYMSKISYDIDLSSIDEPGEYEFEGTVNLPNQYITTAKKVSVKIPIKVSYFAEKSVKLYTKQTGNNKNYIIKSEPETNQINIQGAEEEIKKVAYASADVNTADITTNFDVMGEIYFCDKNGDKLNDVKSVSAEIANVKIKNTLYNKQTVKIKPVLSQELSEEYVLIEKDTVISPMEIEIGVLQEGMNAEVEVEIDDITKAKEYKAVCNAEGVYIPYNNSLVTIEPVVSKKVKKIVDLTVSAKNSPENLTLYYTPQISVTIECVEGTEANDVSAVIDLKDVKKGFNSVKVEIEGDKVISYDDVYVGVECE